MSSHGVYYFGPSTHRLKNGELVARVVDGIQYDCLVPVGVRISERSTFEYESKFDMARREINTATRIYTGEPEVIGK